MSRHICDFLIKQGLPIITQIENDRLEEEKQQEESIFEQEYNMQQEKPAEVGEEVVNEE